MVVGGRGWFVASSRSYESLCDLRRDASTVMRSLYRLEMSVSDLPSDIALGENFPDPDKDSDRLKSQEVLGPSPPVPNPEPEVSRPEKQTRCGRRIIP
ncbi:hypothetical protein TNCV_3914691 [Trichonephila clavipes]|nr:hypothetical protein TNCV_3914691 [Trichonephila clavipes]